MDRAFHEALALGIERLRLPVDATALALLERYADRLLAWNRKVNLTAITDAAQVAEKHLVDSLALLPALGGARTLLDVGSGAGIPGVPLACARRDLAVTCCDSVTKKIAFVKAVAVELGVDVRGVVARAEGKPEDERLPRAEAVVSRALADPERWVPLGAAYVAEGGLLLAMLGRDADEAALTALGAAHGLAFAGLDRFELPLSRSARAIARWRKQ
ncbi:16S rRNA (guanine(527)-N(7))-methyltransferase RsmG [Anaeromyxobacter oryzae]|uniref:Ribosomal RNA small subunit methyltransferase G n=1 Tax=Anaeromyxobacter oryzae TaxID=2918170 RepID=A0ABM7WVH8_9BACT|nr:16S rRNA (guanine(527)-N(7))-methyltransferase RsmG [Anaeromyxobacter oryzae]BDG03510.1 ribosomal RNA small subunit methyltransferase G [Anaeromyxobacter oryzae]